ncbi:ABC transporter substrate-binding protein [Alicyclobacillus cycloheptanicus]|uniref:NitT/TauT family transport system substrate-binding protein n=1 Tax=Alicyclobacillus cycloheptanicus TaxID=1457 RepID=A0ABT9XHQ1_9BACL|nr:ABC transporter substrate-binding protein [Alicyclobacillus cycloheptanicus]MDQ0189831.1 NitT/TauT family transport system substrate-binding protein [Alicyclobacillus cycloheptanicus]WDM02482.1 ABC transporter substrate-binding protein [Alicyclobacillus cycloheptanicus]
MKRVITSTVTLIALGAGLVAGCGTSGSGNTGSTASTQNTTGSSGGGGAQTVTVGTTPLVSSAPVFLAEDLGYWKKLGLNVQIKTYEAAGDIDVATAANSLDVSATGITASLFNMWASGKKEYIVADKGRIWPGQHFEALVASNQAWNSGLKSVADLKGKKFGDTTAGSTFDFLLGTMLSKDNLSLSDIQDVPLHTTSNVAAAVQTGQVDAAILPQPAANQEISNGKVHLIAWVDDNVKADLLVMAYSPQFRTQTDTATKFMEGYLEAVQFYMQHVYHNKNTNDPDLKKALNIISKYTQQPASVVQSELIYVDPNAEVDPSNIENQLKFYEQNGMVQGSVSVNDMIDNSFLKAAQQKVGSAS